MDLTLNTTNYRSLCPMGTTEDHSLGCQTQGLLIKPLSPP